MTNSSDSELLVKERWDESNAAGRIHFRADTLTTKDLVYEGTTFHLIHNACRDTYDRSAKAIDRPSAAAKPFADGSNPELARTEDGWFRIMGNRFACVQYQCVLVPDEPLEELTEDFLDAGLRFASKYPSLTLMYNALGAGKTVPAQFWLLSFARYAALENFAKGCEPVGTSHSFEIVRRFEPCYALMFQVDDKTREAASLLVRLTHYMKGQHFNMFLYNHHAVFIPREGIEIPSGFDNHRFGGLEMIGCFVMKSADALAAADPTSLLAGIKEISYSVESQRALEEFIQKGS